MLKIAIAFATGFLGLVSMVGTTAADEWPACDGPDREVRPIERMPPPYPHQARLLCIEGSARVEFTITVDGTVEDIEIVDSEPADLFDGAARVVRFWRFEPRCADGRLTPRRATQYFEFTLDDLSDSDCLEALPEDLVDVMLSLMALHSEARSMVGGDESGDRVFPIDSSLAAPYDTVERATRRYLNERIRLWRDWRSVSDGPLLPERILVPDLLRAKGAIARRARMLERWEQRRRALRARYPAILQRFIDDLDELGDTLVLDAQERAILIEGPVNGLKRDIEANPEVLQRETAIFDAYRDLFDWLEVNRESWRVEDGQFVFDSDSAEHAYRRRFEAIESMVGEWVRDYTIPVTTHWSWD